MADPVRVLLVEDTPGARQVAIRMLTSLGYDVTPTKDADEALSLINAGQTFDVLFTDIIMPGQYDGMQLAHLIHERLPSIKILFTSGFSDLHPQDIEKLKAIYVSKPYRKIEIAAILKSLLGS